MLNIYCQMLMSILVVNSQSMGLGGGFIMTIYLENGTRYSIYLLVPWYSIPTRTRYSTYSQSMGLGGGFIMTIYT